jgi:hypothetical protein
MALEQVQPREYRPVLLSRRGEVTAWILALTAGLSYFALRGLTANLSWVAVMFVGIFFLSAASISLGNWMDRQTVIQVGPQGLKYRNGLRRTQFAWGEVREVQISPSRFGDQVHVIGDDSHFRFRLHADIHYQGEVRGQMGFSEGEEILALILEQNRLRPQEGDAPSQYYARG